MINVNFCFLNWWPGGLTNKVWPLTVIVEGSPVGRSFDSRVSKPMYSHFRILSTVFWDIGGISSATTTEDEHGRSLIGPSGILGCSSPSAGSTRVDVTTETSAGRQPNAGHYIPVLVRQENALCKWDSICVTHWACYCFDLPLPNCHTLPCQTILTPSTLTLTHCWAILSTKYSWLQGKP